MKKVRHIILSGNTAWSMYNFRGALIRALISNGYKVTVIAPYDDIFTSKLIELSCNFISVTLNPKGINPFQDIYLMMQYRKILRKEKPDFLFFYTIKPNIYGSIAASFCRIPYVAVTTGLGYTFLKNNWISKTSKILYKWAFRKAYQVWFLNEEDKRSFINTRLVSSHKTFVLKGEGIDLSRFLISDLHKNDDQTIFLLIARMLWAKGVGEFVEAARIVKKKNPHARFQLLGFLGVDNPDAISREQINSWHEEGVIEYLGSTGNVIPFINTATCIVLPSYYREGIPFSLLEASASGKPIITTNSIGCKDTIEDGITGYICEVKNPTSLADCMEKIMNLSSDQYIKMGLAGRDKMEREFDIKLIIKKYLDVLDKFYR